MPRRANNTEPLPVPTREKSVFRIGPNVYACAYRKDIEQGIDPVSVREAILRSGGCYALIHRESGPPFVMIGGAYLEAPFADPAVFRAFAASRHDRWEGDFVEVRVADTSEIRQSTTRTLPVRADDRCIMIGEVLRPIRPSVPRPEGGAYRKVIEIRANDSVVAPWFTEDGELIESPKMKPLNKSGLSLYVLDEICFGPASVEEIHQYLRYGVVRGY